MNKLILRICSLLVMLVGFVPSAHATKTAPILPIQLTVTPTTAKPGDTVKYLLHIPNKSDSKYWGVTATVHFPAGLSCNQLVSTTRGGCTLANNKLTCSYNDVGDWWIIDAVVACQVLPTAQCGGTLTANATLNVMKPAPQTNQASAVLNVQCAEKAKCQDGIDNDGDGLVDLNDPGCTDGNDGDETNPKLKIVKSIAPTITAGGIAAYSFAVSNIGNAAANAVQSVDYFVDPVSKALIAPPLTYLNASIPGCRLAAFEGIPNSAIYCALGTIAPGQTINYTVNFQVPDNGNLCAKTIANNADVHLSPGNTKLSDWSMAFTTVNCTPKFQCSDGIDNDGDGRIDLADPGCSGPTDNNEGDEPACQDGKDNDGDGKIDLADPGCSGPTDPTENDEAQCQDGRDNDGDGKIDFPNDPGCSSPTDNNEGDEPACQDGKDNDGDGKIDLADPGCSGPTDPTENDEPQCKDTRDNDGDGKIDFPADPGCSSPTDNNEGDEAQCQDGKDNDADGKIDFPADPGCSSATDNNEGDEPKVECNDGKDNDNDGWIDFPEDGGCSSKEDNSERDPNGPQCDNGKDDDGDGKLDFPNDPDCTGPTDPTEAPQCSDKKDNDSDGWIDLEDAGCSSPTDDNESDEPQCADKKDNDKDGKIDLLDPGCKNPLDNDESDDPKPQCADGKDNDSDGKIDLADPGCSSATDDNESDDPKYQCNDGIDNDGDGWIDFPEDSGCTSENDNDEKNAINPITPIVSCVLDNGDGSATAFFGYVNSGPAVTIAAGVSDQQNINAFSPVSADQGQPSNFKSGQNDAAFSVVFPGHLTLTWTVMYQGSAKNTVTAKKGTSKECIPVTPIVECVDQKSTNQYTARFGYENQNTFEVPMEIGQYNLFTPAPEDRGQPDKFFKGLVKTAFTVDFDGTDLTWKLGVKAITASKTSKSCNPNLPPVCDAGGPYEQVCQGDQTKIKLDGSASKDPEGKTLTYKWSTTCQEVSIDNATAVTPTITLAGPGKGVDAECKAILVVSDGVQTSTCDAPVSVPACDDSDCTDSAGQPGQKDQCGVCNGDGKSCVGCDGVVNSGKTIDSCGVCGGNNSCNGCDGVPNSGATPDACGVCGGNGQSCLQCTDTNIKNTLLAMDNNTKDQEANAKSALRRLSNNAKDAATKKFVAQAKIEVDKLGAQAWQLTWSLPQDIKTCAESNNCVQSDNSATINSFNTAADGIRDIAQQALRELSKALGGKLRASDKKIGVAADRLYDQSVALSSTVPRFQSTCN